MDIIKNIKDIYNIDKSVITIGNFDGVHNGHKTLINKVLDYKKKNKCSSIVFTFSNHPVNYFKPNTIKNIITNKEKLEIFYKKGIDIAINIPFDKYMTQIEAKEFVKEILINKLKMQKLIIGYDFSFARNKEGNVDLLKKLSKEYNFELEVVEPIMIENVRISSTHVRDLISQGEIEKVNEYLGYNFSMSGTVIQGRQIGRTIGYPTANIDYDKTILIPKIGIYATYVYIDDKKYIGATNVGYNPTVNGKKLSVETHIIDFDEDIYQKEIKIEFLERIRNEKKFNNLDELKNQLQKDTNYIIKNYICKK